MTRNASIQKEDSVRRRGAVTTDPEQVFAFVLTSKHRAFDPERRAQVTWSGQELRWAISYGLLSLDAGLHAIVCREHEMSVHLIVGDRNYPIPSGDLIRVGSHDACDIRILNDAFISRRHCSVSYVDGQLSIVDLDSTHGTLVNGEDIGRQPRELRHGDQVNVGGSLLVVRFSDAEETSP